MSHFFRFRSFILLSLAVVFSAVGCHAKSNQVYANANQVGAQDQGSDPAAANLAQDSNNSGAPLYASAAAPSYQQNPPPQDQGYGSYQPPDQSSDDPGYGQQPSAYASEPPPPLPDYDQPQAPGDDYIWTPGYWAWSPQGYYWVPGAWVEAPYEGALWTPATGAFGTTVMAFTAAIGAGTSATMAASTMALAISASATRAVIGVVATSTTTDRSITSTSLSYTTCTTALLAGTAGEAPV